MDPTLSVSEAVFSRKNVDVSIAYVVCLVLVLGSYSLLHIRTQNVPLPRYRPLGPQLNQLTTNRRTES